MNYLLCFTAIGRESDNDKKLIRKMLMLDDNSSVTTKSVTADECNQAERFRRRFELALHAVRHNNY